MYLTTLSKFFLLNFDNSRPTTAYRVDAFGGRADDSGLVTILSNEGKSPYSCKNALNSTATPSESVPASVGKDTRSDDLSLISLEANSSSKRMRAFLARFFVPTKSFGIQTVTPPGVTGKSSASAQTSF